MHLFLEGIIGDRGKRWTDFPCPYMLCPSNQPFDGAKKSKWKFNQKISPRVYQYRCGHCGCLCNKGLDGPAIPDEMTGWNLNPALVGNQPNFDFRRY